MYVYVYLSLGPCCRMVMAFGSEALDGDDGGNADIVLVVREGRCL